MKKKWVITIELENMGVSISQDAVELTTIERLGILKLLENDVLTEAIKKEKDA